VTVPTMTVLTVVKPTLQWRCMCYATPLWFVHKTQERRILESAAWSVVLDYTLRPVIQIFISKVIRNILMQL